MSHGTAELTDMQQAEKKTNEEENKKKKIVRRLIPEPRLAGATSDFMSYSKNQFFGRWNELSEGWSVKNR